MKVIQEFHDLLKKGEFRIPFCTSCLLNVWPPSILCSRCLLPTVLRSIDLTGTLLEFSTSHLKDRLGKYGILEMGGIRLVGSLRTGEVHVGMKMKMAACGVDGDGSPYFVFDPV